MANTVIGASVDIEFKSIKDLKTALSETEKQFKEMVDTFGEGSQQAQQAQKKLASLQDGINQKTEEYNTKVDAAAQTVSALNATVGGLQGALELTGLASEETEKALSKVTAALSIGDAIQNLTEFGPALATTFNTIKTAGVNTFKALRAAIGTTGIGLIVVAAGAIAMYWDDIKAAVTGYNAELEKANKKNEDHLKVLDFEVQMIEKSRDTRIAQGQTQEQINKELLDFYIKQAELEANTLKNLEAQREFDKAAAQRNYNIVRNITRFAIEAQAAVYRIIGGPLDLLIITANKVSEILGFGKITTFSINEEITKMSKGLSEAAAQKLFDPKEVDENINAARLKATEAQNRVDQLRNQMNEDNAKKAKEISDELEADAQKAAAARLEAEGVLYEALKNVISEKSAEILDLEKRKREEEKKLDAARIVDRSVFEESYRKQRLEIDKKYKDIELQKEKEYRDLLNSIIAESEDQSGKTEAEIARKAIEDKYIKRREEINKQYPNNLALIIALAKAEQAELNKLDESERQKQLKKQEERLQKEAANTELSYNKRIEALSKTLELTNQMTFESEDERRDYIEQTEKKISDLKDESHDKEIERINKLADLTLGTLSVIKQANDADINLKRQQYDQDLANLQQMLNNKEISQEQFEKRRQELDNQQNKELQKSFKRNQIISIAEAIVNTAKGVTNALGTLPPPFSFIQAAATALLGGIQIKTIKNQKPGTVSSASSVTTTGASVSTAAPMEIGLGATATAQALNAEAINNLGNTALRAYVMNSDIQNNSQRNAYLQRNARLG